MEYMTIDEVSAVLNMSRQAIWRAVRNKQIPHQRFLPRGPVKFIKADIEEFIKARTYAVDEAG